MSARLRVVEYVVLLGAMAIGVSITYRLQKSWPTRHPGMEQTFPWPPVVTTAVLWSDVALGIAALSVFSDIWITIGVWYALNGIVLVSYALRRGKEIRKRRQG